MSVWTIKAMGNEYHVKGLKKFASSVSSSIKRLVDVYNFQRELYGIIGEKEESTTYYIPFGNPAKMADPEGYEKAKTEFLSSLSDPITEQNWNGKAREIEEIFNQFVPVVDNRKTEEKDIKEKEECAALRNNREKEREDREMKIGLGLPSVVRMPKTRDQVFVVISAHFNDSDSMTDYFNSNALLSYEYALAIIPKQPKREDTLRNIISNIPELAKLKWTWNKKEYSGGHGVWLESETIGEVPYQAYDGRKKVNYWYEVSYNAYAQTTEKSKYFTTNTKKPVNDSSTTTELKKPANNSTEIVKGITVTKNEEKHGIELRFENKPSRSVLDNLKANGWRWSQRNMCWYIKDSKEAMQFAESLRG